MAGALLQPPPPRSLRGYAGRPDGSALPAFGAGTRRARGGRAGGCCAPGAPARAAATGGPSSGLPGAGGRVGACVSSPTSPCPAEKRRHRRRRPAPAAAPAEKTGGTAGREGGQRAVGSSPSGPHSPQPQVTGAAVPLCAVLAGAELIFCIAGVCGCVLNL